MIKIPSYLNSPMLLLALTLVGPPVFSQTVDDLEWKIRELESRIDELESGKPRRSIDCTPPVRAVDRETCNLRDEIGNNFKRQQNECYDAIEKSIVGEPKGLTPAEYQECVFFELPDQRLIPAMEYQRQKRDHSENWFQYVKALREYHDCERAIFCWNNEEDHAKFRGKDPEGYTEFLSYKEWRSSR